MPRERSDEKYILDLFSSILNTKYKWQHRFNGLLGDKGKNGIARKLPVDGYFPDYNLIVEYLELQHFRSVPIMDGRLTISGVTRDKQRAEYHCRRKKFAVEQGFKYLELTYKEFEHSQTGKLKMNKGSDEIVIRKKLELLRLEK